MTDNQSCPQCGEQLVEPEQSQCHACACFVLHRRYDKMFARLYDEAPNLSAKSVLRRRQRTKAKELAERLKARKRYLTNLFMQKQIKVEQANELQGIDEHIGKFDAFYDLAQKTKDFDFPMSDVLGAVSIYLKNVKEKGQEKALGEALGRLTQRKLPESSEAEKITQQTEEQMAARKAQRKPIDDEIDETEKEKLELERSIGKLEKMPTDSDVEELLQIKISKLERLNDDIIGLKQKRKRMAG